MFANNKWPQNLRIIPSLFQESFRTNQFSLSVIYILAPIKPKMKGFRIILKNNILFEDNVYK